MAFSCSKVSGLAIKQKSEGGSPTHEPGAIKTMTFITREGGGILDKIETSWSWSLRGLSI